MSKNLINYYYRDDKTFIKGEYTNEPLYEGMIFEDTIKPLVVVSYEKVSAGLYNAYVEEYREESSHEYKLTISFYKNNDGCEEFVKNIHVDMVPVKGSTVIIDGKYYKVIDFIVNYDNNTKICIVK